MPPSVCVVTSGHLASTPRMLKVADALHEAGYRVRVVCSEHVDWCVEAGKQIRATRTWPCRVVDWHPETGKSLYHWSRWRHKVNHITGAVINPRHLSLSRLARAICRVAPELVREISAEPTDLIYAGTSGALAVAALAAYKLQVPFALDLEDFHTGERAEQDTHLGDKLLAEIELRVLTGAAFLTTSSQPISDAYQTRYQLRPITVHNVFSLPNEQPNFRDRNEKEPFKLFWFSQVIGPSRGLDDIVHAANDIHKPVWLGLVGNVNYHTEYVRSIYNKAKDIPDLTLELLGNCHPEQLLYITRQSDVGLALEPGFSKNNDFAASNKIFTYMIAGLAIAATNTQGQISIAKDLGEGALLYRPGDVAILAAGLKRWATDPDALLRAKRASWDAAVRRWHWEHPLERGAVLDAVAKVIGKP